jgi:hypothetical protein
LDVGEIHLATTKNDRLRPIPLVGDLSKLMDRRWSAREYPAADGVTGISEYVFHRGGEPLVAENLGLSVQDREGCGPPVPRPPENGGPRHGEGGYPAGGRHDYQRAPDRERVPPVQHHQQRDQMEALRRTQEYGATRPATRKVVNLDKGKEKLESSRLRERRRL